MIEFFPAPRERGSRALGARGAQRQPFWLWLLVATALCSPVLADTAALDANQKAIVA